MYVCGPTVSGESHLGHARPFITFDVVYRYLHHLGYKVRYVRNITDAGHFEEEGREAEDKISKKALLEKIEPMELVQKYTNLFHWAMKQFNNLEPNIEPTATGHIVEQINMIEKIIDAGYAYVVNGSVYFDVKKYAASHDYGKLSGRVLMIFWKPHAILKARKKKEIKLILLYGKQLRRNISCAGKVHGVRAFPGGILNARQWLQNILGADLIFMAAVWIFYFHIMKVRLHKAPFAIIIHLQNTGCIII